MVLTAPGALDERLAALFNSEPAAMANPYPLYAELRERAPVHEFKYGVLVSRYEDVKTVVQDVARFSSSPNNKRGDVTLTPEEQHAYNEVIRYEAMQVSLSNGEQHERLRRIAHRAFTPRRILELEESMRQYADEMLTELAREDLPDFAGFAYRFPLMIIGDLLGVPMEDREQVHAWSVAIGRFKSGIIEPGPTMAAYTATQEFLAYVADMVRERASSPGATLAETLLDARQEERLSVEELMVMFLLLLLAGHETTSNLFSNGILTVLGARDQWRALAANPELATNATEELLRHTTPAQWLQRTPLEDVELSGGEVKAGAAVVPMLAAANRDPSMFADPDRLDVARPNARQHLTFGFGAHYCLGQAVARAEGRIVLETLARRFPDAELAADTFEWTGSALLRRPVSVPVRLGRERGGP